LTDTFGLIRMDVSLSVNLSCFRPSLGDNGTGNGGRGVLRLLGGKAAIAAIGVFKEFYPWHAKTKVCRSLSSSSSC
jgi:hypothetical protein